MNFHLGRRLFVAAAVVGALALFVVGFFVALTVRSVVADPGGSAPNPGHEWSEIEGHGVVPGAYSLGSIGNNALELQVNGERALRLEPDATSPNVIGGYTLNSVAGGVYGATIGGGGANLYRNQVTDDYGVVGGGRFNLAGDETPTDRSYATVGGGNANTASGFASTVGGGASNVAGDNATVGGGARNEAQADFATVGGGDTNTANNEYATVAGGESNTASGHQATIGGGDTNNVSGAEATVGGGAYCTASGQNATVSGGRDNTADNEYATVGGGESNTAGWSWATVGGGARNEAQADFATVGGGDTNIASANNATVGGGQENSASALWATVGGGYINHALEDYATVGGGGGNIAAGFLATVGGGGGNSAGGITATVGGGETNTASASFATVPGGAYNTAAGEYSFAAGRRAKAYNDGCFVWGDSTDGDIICAKDNRFMIRASGGVYMLTSADHSTGAYLAAGSGSWSDLSDRNLKENFTPVDGQELLARLAEIPITTWNYKAQDSSIRHMGPVAQDFYAAFGLGEDELHISTIDPDGVALAAIQGLYEIVQEQDGRIQALEAENDDLEARVAALEGEAEVNGGSAGSLSSIIPAGWLLFGALFLGGLVLVQRRRAGGRR